MNSTLACPICGHSLHVAEPAITKPSDVAIAMAEYIDALDRVIAALPSMESAA